MELLTLLILFFVLALAAWRWGFDSRDGPLSPEWERRRWHDVDRQRRNERKYAQQFAQFGQNASRIDPHIYEVVYLDEQAGS